MGPRTDQLARPPATHSTHLPQQLLDQDLAQEPSASCDEQTATLEALRNAVHLVVVYLPNGAPVILLIHKLRLGGHLK